MLLTPWNGWIRARLSIFSSNKPCMTMFWSRSSRSPWQPTLFDTSCLNSWVFEKHKFSTRECIETKDGGFPADVQRQKPVSIGLKHDSNDLARDAHVFLARWHEITEFKKLRRRRGGQRRLNNRDFKIRYDNVPLRLLLPWGTRLTKVFYPPNSND